MIVALTTEQSWWHSWVGLWRWVGTMQLVDAIDWRRPRFGVETRGESTCYQALGKELASLYGLHEDTFYVRRPNGELMYHSAGSYKRYLEMGDDAWQAEREAMFKPRFEEVSVSIVPHRNKDKWR